MELSLSLVVRDQILYRRLVFMNTLSNGSRRRLQLCATCVRNAVLCYDYNPSVGLITPVKRKEIIAVELPGRTRTRLRTCFSKRGNRIFAVWISFIVPITWKIWSSLKPAAESKWQLLMKWPKLLYWQLGFDSHCQIVHLVTDMKKCLTRWTVKTPVWVCWNFKGPIFYAFLGFYFKFWYP